jgi:hypothetical protein
MQLSVLIEPAGDKGYRAEGIVPFHFTVEGATRDEVLLKVRSPITNRMANGAEIVTLDVPVLDHPLAQFVGDLRDDPLLEGWKEAMAEYRRQREKELDART